MSFFEPHKNGILLRVKLTPSAAKSCFGAEVFTDVNGSEYLKAGVTAVAEKGKANKELLKMVAKNLKIAVSDMEIISGQTEHLKKILIHLPLTEDLKQKIALLKKEK